MKKLSLIRSMFVNKLFKKYSSYNDGYQICIKLWDRQLRLYKFNNEIESFTANLFQVTSSTVGNCSV